MNNRKKRQRQGPKERFRSNSRGYGGGWKSIYLEAFPAAERQPVDVYMNKFRDGSALLHETRIHRKVLCMSIIEPAHEDVVLLAYIATHRNTRGGGVGRRHLLNVLDVTRDQFAGADLFLEVDDPDEAGISAAERSIRTRRIGWYKRLGAQMWDCSHQVPSFADASAPPTMLKLMAFSNDGRQLSDDDFAAGQQNIYRTCYELNDEEIAALKR